MDASVRWTPTFAVLGFVALSVSCTPERGSVGGTGTGLTGASGGDAGTGGGDGDDSGGTAGGSGGSGSGSPSSGGDGDGDGDGDSGGGIRLDVSDESGSGGPGEGGSGDCGCGDQAWSYVWIANSSENTVSKINTTTLVEEGRYATGGVSPSRTSVSVDGRAVVVANRHVGLTKIWARPEDCAGANTSTGPGDVKPWGQDDCVAWHAEFPGASVQRPVAWTPGTLNPVTCQYENQQIWTTTGSGGLGGGQCGPNGIKVHLVNGDTGMIDDEITIPESEFDCEFTGTGQPVGLGPYGGAVDNEGNFWFHGWGNNKLVRVDLETLDYEITSGGSYGITVDTQGRVWTNSIARYDPMTGQWQQPPSNSSGNGGIAQDLQGRIWAAAGNGGGGPSVVWVDMETLALGDTIALPVGGGTGNTKGVSVDINGFIWATVQGDTNAYRIDPTSYDIQTVTGLNDPYTYSDMTGGQLTNVNCNPPVG